MTDPQALSALLRRALTAHQQGQIDDAERLYQDILIQDPGHFDALHLAGVVRMQRGDLDGALNLINRAIAVDMNQAPALNNRGAVLSAMGRHEDAIGDFDRAIALLPQNAEAIYNKGRAQLALGQIGDALDSFNRAIVLRPDYIDAYLTRGVTLAQAGDHGGAIENFDRALQLHPNIPDAHFNRGNALAELGRYDQALAAYGRALALDPAHADALNNRGNVLRLLGRNDEALADFSSGSAARPEFAGVLVNRAMALLLMGRYSEGWPAYEARFATPELSPLMRRFTQPRWTGAQDVAGKTVLLMAEQGLGDTLQFCRYAAMVAARGARVIMEVQPSLKTLLSRLDGVSALYGENEQLPGFDYYVPLLSLPAVFGTTLDSIPKPAVFQPVPAKVAEWATRMPPGQGLRVGLVWAGQSRPGMPAAAAIDRKRSIPLAAFAPLGEVPGVRFFSLQKGEPAAQLAEVTARGWTGPRIVDTSGELVDFSDTAAACVNLDLVVTCDTAVAHLAGSMNRPTWVLSRADGCWRWLAQGTGSPWYPSVRLFRQKTTYDWAPVIAEVKSALEGLAKTA